MKHLKQFENVFDNIPDYANFGTIDMDMTIDFSDENDAQDIFNLLNKNNIFCQFLAINGPGGGWPLVRLLGTHDSIQDYLLKTGMEEEDVNFHMKDWESI